MEQSITVFDVIRIVLFWLSPVIFLVGITLVLYGNYKNLEETLGKEIGGIKKRVFPKLETNILTFHEWLLGRRTLIGLICVILSIVVFLVFKQK